MTESKKVWVEPELIVLVRHNPEEAVLANCKHGVGVGGGGPVTEGYGAICSTSLSCGQCDNFGDS